MKCDDTHMTLIVLLYTHISPFKSELSEFSPWILCIGVIDIIQEIVTKLLNKVRSKPMYEIRSCGI